MNQDYTLIHGDCLDKMSQIEDGSIDMICADLPYQVTNCKWDKMIPFEPLWAHYKRVIKKRGAVVLFGTFPFTAMLWASNPVWYKYKWTWDKVKPNGMGYAKYQPMRRTEEILVFCNGNTIYNPQVTKRNTPRKYRNYSHSLVNNTSLAAMDNDKVTDFYYPNDLLQYSNADQTKRLHPTQKPVSLLEFLIRTYTNEGELILDSTMGSGSTGEACLRTGRRFIGIEKELNYYEIGKERLERVTKELTNQDLPLFAQAG